MVDHKHPVVDGDVRLKIDPITRKIQSASGKTSLIQGDHNSERFTFEVPRRVDGHDLSLCDVVQVHYINIDAKDKTKTSADFHEVDDLKVSTEDENIVVFSWLIDGKALRYAGTLSFAAKFKCTENGETAYVWNTAVYSGVSVSDGMDNSGAIVEEYSDVLEQWRQDNLDAIAEVEAKIIGKAGTGQNSETFNDDGNVASGDFSHAEGDNTTASGVASHAEGGGCQAHGDYSHAEGCNNGNTKVTASGKGSHAEGVGTQATGEGSHAEGKGTAASGVDSHAEGRNTYARGNCSHAEGQESEANQGSAHAEGYKNIANGDCSHAEGNTNCANGSSSHVEGLNNFANGDFQHVQGKYNVADDENKYAHIVGGGTSDSDRKNIHTVDWEGNAYYEGTVEAADGLILKSPSGKRFLLVASDSGSISLEALT